MTELQYQIQGIPAVLIDKFWHFAEPYVKRALDHTTGEYSPDDLKVFCQKEITQLWLITKGERVVGAVTTELVVYPKRKFCHIITLGGSKAEEWTQQVLIPVLEAWAKEKGCSVLSAYVRKGYVPKLLQYGFKHKCSVVYREFE